MLVPAVARAQTEWQIRPFAGLTFGGSTGIFDPEGAVGKRNGVYGISAALLGDVFGLEFDLARAPGFFETDGPHLVANSSATTLTGNVTVGLSRQATKYVLRPYFVGGFGLMHARYADALNFSPTILKRPAMDIGGGATGFLADRIGLNWELRYFRSLGGGEIFNGTTIDGERLSFFRVNMALVVKL
jgi:hypothetical protein